MERMLGCDCRAIHKDAVERVREQRVQQEALVSAVEFYKVIGDETRMNILCALSVEELCVCDICVLLDMTKSAVSHQLGRLKAAGQVKSRKSGKQVYYSLADEPVKQILEQTFRNLGYEKTRAEQKLPSWLL